MTILDEVNGTLESEDSRPDIWMLDEMAEGLEDQAAGLSCRAAGFEEEESLLSKEIARHETEINRLLLRLDAVRSDRDSVLERIETLKREASSIRERILLSEEEAALASIDPSGFETGIAPTHTVFRAPITRPLNAA